MVALVWLLARAHRSKELDRRLGGVGPQDTARSRSGAGAAARRLVPASVRGEHARLRLLTVETRRWSRNRCPGSKLANLCSCSGSSRDPKAGTAPATLRRRDLLGRLIHEYDAAEFANPTGGQVFMARRNCRLLARGGSSCN